MDEINAQYLIFPGRFQSTEEGPERSQGGPTHQGSVAKGWGAPPYGVAPPGPLRGCLSAYLRTPSRKPYTNKPRYEKPSRAAAIAKPRSGGTGVSVPARRRDGEVPPEGISIDITAIFIDAADSYDEEGVVLP